MTCITTCSFHYQGDYEFIDQSALTLRHITKKAMACIFNKFSFFQFNKDLCLSYSVWLNFPFTLSSIFFMRHWLSRVELHSSENKLLDFVANNTFSIEKDEQFNVSEQLGTHSLIRIYAWMTFTL